MSSHQCVINLDGAMKCWGLNDYGQLGYNDRNDRGDVGNELGPYLSFISMKDNQIPIQACTGGAHTCILTASYDVQCWGLNNYGQLGLGSTDNEIVGPPKSLNYVYLSTVGHPIHLTCGRYHTCLVFNNKKVKCFGKNSDGEIGYENIFPLLGQSFNDMGDNLPYIDLGANSDAKYTYSSGGASHTCVGFEYSQAIKCWGLNNFGQLGYGDTISRGLGTGTLGDNLLTVDLGDDDNVKAVAIGNTFTCVVRIDDALRCFGQNENGQLGTGSTTSPMITMGNSMVSIIYDSGLSIKQISAGRNHLCLLFDDNVTLKCIGDNSAGQLGQGDTLQRGHSLPTRIPSVSAVDLGTGALNISYIEAFDYATCVFFIDYSVKCFGDGANGRTGHGNTNKIGDESNEMGSYLSFSEVFSTFSPTKPPSKNPTKAPTKPPTFAPSLTPSLVPTIAPTYNPSLSPTKAPTTSNPTTVAPTLSPTSPTTKQPTKAPATIPTSSPATANSNSITHFHSYLVLMIAIIYSLFAYQ